MFKIGDKIRYIGLKNNLDYPTHCPCINEIGEIRKLTTDAKWITILFKSYGITCNYLIKDIKKIDNSPPKNDIEWLDRVQENFKGGV